jgi:hypothetical protein
MSRNSKGCAIVLGGSDWVWIRCLDGGNHDLACPTFAALLQGFGMVARGCVGDGFFFSLLVLS